MIRLILEAVRTWVEETLASFRAMYLGYVTPQMYGAKGDGVTDDTEAIQRLFDSIGNGTTVFFPSGVYNVSDSIIVKKSVIIKGEPMLSKIMVTGNKTLPQSQICYVGTKDNVSIFKTTTWVDLTIDNIALIGNSYTTAWNTEEWTAPPYHVYLENVVHENINGIEHTNGGIYPNNCLFAGFSGYGLMIGQSQDVPNCAFYQCNVGIIEAKFDSKIKNCWFSRGGTAIQCTYESNRHYTTLYVSNCWCDQMRNHFIEVKCDATDKRFYNVKLLVNDNWVDMLDGSAIYVEGVINNSKIDSSMSRCGMMYAGISDADRTNAIKEYADVIVANRITNSYINVSVEKRAVGHPQTPNNAICPSKVVSVLSKDIKNNVLVCFDVLHNEITDFPVYEVQNTRFIAKDSEGVQDGYQYLDFFKSTPSMPNKELKNLGKVVLLTGTSSVYKKGETYEGKAVRVTPTGNENPKNNKWLELRNGTYYDTSDTAVVSSKTYYSFEWVALATKNLPKPTTTEQSTMLANSDIQTEVQTKIADTSKQYLIKVKDVITGNNTYVAVANGRFVALTEEEINTQHPN